MVRTAFIYHPECELHLQQLEHPEHPSRLQAIRRHLHNLHLHQQLLMEQVNDKASLDDLRRVHHPDHIESLQQKSPKQGLHFLDQDTAMDSHSLDAALLAAGAGVMAVKDIMAGTYERAFCAVRPPGHHAEANQAMGFCLFNNIAIATQALRHLYDIERVVIIDFDVHHANGTADIFRKVPNVLLLNSFEQGLYPQHQQRPHHPQQRFKSFAAHSPFSQMQQLWQDEWLPAIEAHRPEFFFISAGFDAHEAEAMANQDWHSQHYYWLTEQIVSQANRFAKGRIVSMLEGGYHLQALAVAVEKHLLALMQHPYDWTNPK